MAGNFGSIHCHIDVDSIALSRATVKRSAQSSCLALNSSEIRPRSIHCHRKPSVYGATIPKSTGSRYPANRTTDATFNRQSILQTLKPTGKHLFLLEICLTSGFQKPTLSHESPIAFGDGCRKR